ncbi:MAG: S8 family serine peptidase [Bacteroidota bacterium]
MARAQSAPGNTDQNYELYQKGRIYFSLTPDQARNIRYSEEKHHNYLNAFGFLQPVYAQHPGIDRIEKTFHLRDANEKLNRIFTMEFSEDSEMSVIINDMEKLDSAIEYAEPVPVEKLYYEPNDPFYLSTESNYNWNWHLDVVNAEAAWEMVQGSPDIKAAVVDNAVWGDHPDLDFEPGNLYDASSETTGSASPPATESQTGEDAYVWSHGTHCMGTVGATNDNNTGIASLAGGVTIMGVRGANDAGEIYYSAEGVQWAVNNGADLVSLSLGSGTHSVSMETFYQNVYDAGVVVLAASGNDGVDTYSYPAAYSSVIAVGACNEDKSLSGFSNYGTWVDIAAPGGFSPDESGNLSQLSTTFCESYAAGSVPGFSGEYYDIMQGTSMACPSAASLVALLLSCDNTLSPEEIKTALMASSQTLTGGNSINSGGGVIDAEAALLYIGCAADVPPTADFSASGINTCSGNIQFTDQSSQAETWAWDFGDGNTSNQENPEHIYTENGIYTVSLTVSNSYGSDTFTETDFITVDLPESPLVTDAERCGAGELTLSASGNGTVSWYDAENGGNLIASGTDYTENFTQSTTYYAGVESDNSQTYYVGNTDSNVNGDNHTNNAYHNEFTAISDFTLVSVELNAASAGNRTIELWSGETMVEEITVNIPAGISRVNLNFDVSAGDYSLRCGNDNPDLWRNNSGVDFPYTIAGIMSITGSTAGADYYYFFYDWEIEITETCQSARTPVTATIHSLPDPDIGPDQSVCENGEVTFDAGSGYSAYNWSSTETSQSILVSDAGIYSVTVTDENGCEAQDQAELIVDDMPDASVDPQPDLCVNDSPVSLTAAVSGGIWSGPGVFGDTFDPVVAGPGDHSLTYELSSGSCTASDSVMIHVMEMPAISFSPVEALCVDESPVDISATPTGGMYTGNGITDESAGTFDPSIPGTGIHEITYTVSNSGCTASDVISIYVSDGFDATINPIEAVCENSDPVNLSAADEGGVWTGTAVNESLFDPAIAGPGDHAISYEIGGSCGDTDQIIIHVDEMPEIELSSPGNLCKEDESISLSAIPENGYWTGNGISDNQFNPDLADTGEHMLTYFVDNGACSASDSMIVTLGAAPEIDMSITNASSATSGDGEASATVSGGLSPYEYLWSTGDTSTLIENIPAGNYSLMVTDAAGCFSSMAFSVDFANNVGYRNMHLDVYPNPANNHLYVSMQNLQADRIQVINATGQMLLETKVHSDLEKIDVSVLDAGIYFLRIHSYQNVEIYKVIIE